MFNRRLVLTSAACLPLLAGLASAAPRPAPKGASKRPAAAPVGPGMTLEQARQTVAMLDDAYQITLHQIHDWYPTRSGQPVVAATIVRKLQEKMGQEGWPKSRFLAVRGILMNPDHKARDAFEKRAVSEILGGAERVESVENGTLRTATVLPLGGGCNSCHWAFGQSQDTKAAISFTIPLRGVSK